nr:hypothetical protein [Tanacetum cinerariifolium]
MVRSKNVYHHKMGRGGYVFVKEKMKDADDKIKEGTLNLDDGTNAMTFVFGKENRGYARGVLHTRDAIIQKKSNGLVTSEKEPIKTVGPKKTPKSRRNGFQDSQSQGNSSFRHLNANCST